MAVDPILLSCSSRCGHKQYKVSGQECQGDDMNLTKQSEYAIITQKIKLREVLE